MTKRIVQIALVFMLLIASFASAGEARAWAQCPASVTVQWGDTLGGIALMCDTTVDAIRAANPGLGWWLYAGQVLNIPSGYTPPLPLRRMAGPTPCNGATPSALSRKRPGQAYASLLAVNPQITNPSLIYAGQVIYLPVGAGSPPPNYPPSPPPTYPTQPPPTTDFFKLVKITYKDGLYIRNAPGGTKILSSAMPNTYWYVNTAKIQRFADGSVWVEVKLGEQIDGCWTGWMLVKDFLGKYFTSPRIE
ncbi:MAG: LysM domain-containing protein [Anaerolineales bacterium]